MCFEKLQKLFGGIQKIRFRMRLERSVSLSCLAATPLQRSSQGADDCIGNWLEMILK